MIRLFTLMTAAIMAASATASVWKPLPKKPNVPDTRPVPGAVIDHHGIIINPQPVKMTQNTGEMINASNAFNISKVPTEFQDFFNGMNIDDNGVPVYVSYGEDKASKSNVTAKNGAYSLSMSPSAINIVGYDSDGAFYGLVTFRQIVESALANKVDIPAIEINDYPNMKYRGVVEGFYGTPWSHETRLSLLDFMGKNKMNSYVYGPKDDLYHRGKWRQPYPEIEGKRISELAERARKNHVKFVWAIHPGGDIRWDKADYDSLINKFNTVYDLGVRQFAIFFDDIKGKGVDSHKQAALLNDVIRDFVKSKKDVGNLIICPTEYYQRKANPYDDGMLAVYGNELDPAVDVFWTGEVVCGDIPESTMDFVDQRIKRPALVWWNFPVTDYCRTNLLMGPVYGLDTNLTSDKIAGIETNPMEQGEASKSAIYGVADYSWNSAAYNALDNWTRSFAQVAPGAPEAYGTFAIHSTDPPKNYRRNESWNVETFKYNNYTPAQFNALREEFTKIQAAADELASKSGNMPLVVEIAPWLAEFSNLGERGLMALDLIKIYESGDKNKFKEAYRMLETINEIQKTGYLEHRSGTLRLQPFIDAVLADLKLAYNAK